MVGWRARGYVFVVCACVCACVWACLCACMCAYMLTITANGRTRPCTAFIWLVSAYQLALDAKDLAYSQLAAVVKTKTAEGMVGAACCWLPIARSALYVNVCVRERNREWATCYIGVFFLNRTLTYSTAILQYSNQTVQQSYSTSIVQCSRHTVQQSCSTDRMHPVH